MLVLLVLYTGLYNLPFSFGVQHLHAKFYRGKWRELDVAVKQMKNMHATEGELKDFVSEVTIFRNLRAHPNVVLFIGVTVPPQPLAIIT